MKLFGNLSAVFGKKKEQTGGTAAEGNAAISVYTVFAGINGSGKTSLYNVLCAEENLGERVNIDEIAMSMGSWRDTLVQVKAGRTALKRIQSCIENRVSFHQETTLPGPTVLRHIKMAHDSGFFIRLYFVGIDSLEEAIERVHKRVRLGGHGIDDDVIRERFNGIGIRLREIIPLCDEVIFYDNTVRFRQIAILRGGELIDCDGDLPQWFRDLGIEPCPDQTGEADGDESAPLTDAEYYSEDVAVNE